MQTKLGDNILVVGKAIKDSEFKYVGTNGTPVTSFSLNVGKRKDTTTIFVNCKAWYALAEYSAKIKKGDSVIVIGHTEEREYNGKTYVDLIAEWLNVVSDNTEANVAPNGKSMHSAIQTDNKQTSAFTELDEGDGDLPF